MSKKSEKQEVLISNSEGKIKNVEEYIFEPIKGYPMLNWKGKRPFESTQFFPAQLKECHGNKTKGWMNKIYWGDNLQVMSHLLKEFRGKIDLVYIDPPFDSKADYKKKIKLKNKKIDNDYNSFEEKQYSDIWNNDEYLQFMYERLILLKELLSSKGSIFIHCDYRKVHHFRCMLDEVFGNNNFVNEIIWHYVIGASTNQAFGRKHHTILFYAKDDNERVFNRDRIGVSYSEETLARALRGEARYNKSVEEMEENGKNPGDVWKDCNFEENELIWSDIHPLQGNSVEKENYPTQKPKALLERIIESSTKESDIILDCFMGSGTAMSVAMKHGRRFIGADINLGAIQTTTKRLLDVKSEIEIDQLRIIDEELLCYTGFEVYNVNNYDIFRNPVQAKDILMQALEVEPMINNSVYDGEKDGRKVKIMPVNRIATRADLNELISNFDYKSFEKKNSINPNKPVEHLLIVCMGHEPDLAATLKEQMKKMKFEIDVEIVDILRDKTKLEFKRDSDAEIEIKKGKLTIKQFYPMNLLSKLSMRKESVKNWKELVESVMIDFNYDGKVLKPQITDVPDKDHVKGIYEIPAGAKRIKVKITDLLSESFEGEFEYEN